MKIAFIGTGIMGRPMADRLVKAQFNVSAYDINPLALAGFKGQKATSHQEAAQDADVLILMVVSSQQAKDVLLKQGALAALNSQAYVILCPTCAPLAVEDLARKVQDTGRVLIDCPVSGGPQGAKNGELTLMVACEKTHFTQLQPLLKVLGSKIFHVGEKPSQGAMVKLLNNHLAGINLAAIAECFAWAEQQGLETKALHEIFVGSAAGSYMMSDRGARMVEKTPPLKTHLDILKKDLTLIVETGKAQKANIPLAQIALEKFKIASDKGWGQKDDSCLIEAYRRNT